MQKIFQNNLPAHLAWVMVDSTDFATPESAMSAATVIRVYGKLNGTSGTHFVNSGTGSLAGNAITHVGASATGVYTLALASGALSDASAAFYDMYIFHLSATGAARQTMIASGVRAGTSYLSNALSYLSAIVSQVDSRVLVIQSDAQGNSNILSGMSNTLSAVLVDTATLAGMSDILSQVLVDTATLAGMSDILSQVLVDTAGNSDMLSGMSNILSAVLVDTATLAGMSDILSQVLVDTATLAGMSDILSQVLVDTAGNSDILSQVLVDTATLAGMSDILSQVLVDTAYLSNMASNLSVVVSDHISNFGSRVPGITTTFAQMSDFHSDLRSLTSGITATVGASDISDIASAVQAIQASRLSDILSAAVQANSRALVTNSQVSDIYSLLSDHHSDFQSRIRGTILTMSDTTLPELTSASAPAATPTHEQALMLPYMALRNEFETTASRMLIKNDAGAVIASGVLSADSDSFIQGELS